MQKTNTVNAYLTYNGQCEEAFNFYKSVFGGEFSFVGRFNEMPKDESHPVAAAEANRIMHISLPIGSGTVLMGSDSSEAYGNVTNGTNISMSINAFSKAEADRLYNGLSAGGQQTMPMDNTFWGSYFGMFNDKFGIQWMVSFDENPQQG